MGIQYKRCCGICSIFSFKFWYLLFGCNDQYLTSNVSPLKNISLFIWMIKETLIDYQALILLQLFYKQSYVIWYILQHGYSTVAHHLYINFSIQKSYILVNHWSPLLSTFHWSLISFLLTWKNFLMGWMNLWPRRNIL